MKELGLSSDKYIYEKTFEGNGTEFEKCETVREKQYKNVVVKSNW